MEQTLYLIFGFLTLGAFAGTLAGLFGIGGGLIIVPALIFAFEGLGFDPSVLTQLAVGTSLATIILTSISSVRTHNQKGAVDWQTFKWLTLGIVVGGYLGTQTAIWLPGEKLQWLIGIFAYVIAVQMGFGLKPSGHRELPNAMGMSSVGGVIGWASTIFGIGGGSLTVPFLSWCNQSMHRAVGTAAACGLPIAIVGTLSFMVTGWGETRLPENALGYMYWPAWLGIVITSVPFARLGARLAHSLDQLTMKRGFAVLLVIIGTKFIFF